MSEFLSRGVRLRRILVRPEAALFALVLGSCAYFYQAGGWNQNSRFDLVRAIVEDHSLRIDRLARNTGDLSKVVRMRDGRDGHFYCDKAPGISWMAVPPYAVVHAIAGSKKPSPSYLAWSAWLATVVSVAIPSAIAAVFLALLIRAFGVRAGPACAAAAAWSLATLAWPYGTLLYGHQTVASLLLIGFAMIAIPHLRAEVPSRGRLVGAGLVLGFAVVVEYPALLACLAIGGYAIAVHGWRRALLVAAGAVPPAIALAIYHHVGFGGPLTLPYEFSTQSNRSKGFFMGIGVPKPTALWHILLSSYRGLFRFAPWLLLAIPGGVMLARRGRVAETIVCAVIFVLFVWLNASLVDWEGGWAMGARYLVPCLPFVVVLVAGLLVPAPVAQPVLSVISAKRFDDGSRQQPAGARERSRGTLAQQSGPGPVDVDAAAQGGSAIVTGIVAIVIGVAITIGTRAASSSSGGGTYLVAYGPIVFGVIKLFQGFLSGGATTRPLRIVEIVVVVALVGYSSFHMLVGTAVKPEVPTHIKRPYADFLYPQFFDGKLAVSTQSIDDAGAPKNKPRQAWNLGHKLGLDGAASLVPLLVWMLACGALIARGARRDNR